MHAFAYKHKCVHIYVPTVCACAHTFVHVRMQYLCHTQFFNVMFCVISHLSSTPCHQCPFNDLKPDSLNATVMKYVKTVYQLEKGLPPNSVVPKLKEKVELMRDKVPVVTDLRNPSLKKRHWEKIEEIVQQKFELDELTLKVLTEFNAFEHAEQIQEVSGQASSEASLESMLKKVEDSWKATEFIVLSHRDSKDVFILGGTDDIQVVLDDSMVNVSTIAGSRHVGPIKPKVDEWSKQLQLFSETLVRTAVLLCAYVHTYLHTYIIPTYVPTYVRT